MALCLHRWHWTSSEWMSEVLELVAQNVVLTLQDFPIEEEAANCHKGMCTSIGYIPFQDKCAPSALTPRRLRLSTSKNDRSPFDSAIKKTGSVRAGDPFNRGITPCNRGSANPVLHSNFRASATRAGMLLWLCVDTADHIVRNTSADCAW